MLGQPMFLPPPVVVGVRVTGALPAGTTATDLVLTLTQMLRAHGVVGTVRGVLRGRALLARARRPRHALEHVPGVRGDRVVLPGRRRDAPVPAAHRPGGSGRPRRALHQGAGPVPARRRSRAGLQRGARPRPLLGGALARRSAPAAGPGVALRGLALVRRGLPRPARGRAARRPTRSTTARSSSRRSRAARTRRTRASCSRRGCSRRRRSRPGSRRSRGSRRRSRRARAWSPTTSTPPASSPTSTSSGSLSSASAAPRASGTRAPCPTRLREAVTDRDLAVVAVLSGNRNFEGRIHPQVRASYLASPPLVRRVRARRHRGDRPDGRAARRGRERSGLPARRLADARRRSARRSAGAISPEQFRREYGRIFDGDERWNALPSPTGAMYAWDPGSTYVREPPFFERPRAEAAALARRRRRPVPGEGRRLDHDRPHLAGGLDQGGLAGRAVPDRARRRAAGLQQLRRAPRQPRGDDAGHVRERPAPQRARSRHRGTVDDAAARRRGRGDLRGGGAVPRARGAADRARRQGVRERLVSRLGREGRRRCSAFGRSWPRASSGSTAATSSAWACCRCSTAPGESAGDARAVRDRDVRHPRTRERRELRAEVEVVARAEDGSETRFAAIVRIDGAAEVEYFRHGGILRMVVLEKLSA